MTLPAGEAGPPPERTLRIPLRYLPGTGFALALAITVGIVWEQIPERGTWPIAAIAIVAMLCDTVIIASRNGRWTVRT
ncbi:hypothetical protein ACFV9D_23325 [Streptomyces sp. NPDC059875]|uniref:hypothetical protein n=1 Tax=unclassified Streptomyces TaxID=2593676 RepID=UPI0036490476